MPNFRWFFTTLGRSTILYIYAWKISKILPIIQWDYGKPSTFSWQFVLFSFFFFSDEWIKLQLNLVITFSWYSMFKSRMVIEHTLKRVMILFCFLGENILFKKIIIIISTIEDVFLIKEVHTFFNIVSKYWRPQFQHHQRVKGIAIISVTYEKKYNLKKIPKDNFIKHKPLIFEE